MRWAFKWSDHLATGFYYEMLRKGLIREADYEPPLGPFEFYFDAFQDLSTCRSIGMGPGPIPFTAIVQYSTLYEIEDRDDFIYLIRIMDNAFLELVSEKTKAGAPKDGSKSGKANYRKARH